MVLLSVTAHTWIVTGLGFGIVLVLLFCLVYIIQGLGWVMQKVTAPKTPKQPKRPVAAPADEDKSTAVLSNNAGEEEQAAIAMALYLYAGANHDRTTAPIAPQARSTAWNDKSIGLNNKGF